MANELTETEKRNALNEARRKWAQQVQDTAMKTLVALVGEERAKESAGRLALALRAAVAAQMLSKKKDDPSLYDATPEALANAIAMSALTGLMPGGLNPDCWLVPRGGSAGGMVWMVSHRGIVKLVRRAGYEIEPVIVYRDERFVRRRTPFLSIEHDERLDVEQSYNSIVAAYCIFWPEGKRDEWRAHVISADEIDLHRKASSFANGSIWTTWWASMVMKTIIKATAARGFVPLDDVGMVAFGQDEDAEATRRSRAIETTATVAAPASKRLAAANPLDALEREYTEPDAEPVKVEAPAEAKPRAARKPKEEKPPANPPAAPDRALLVAAVKEGERVLGPDFAKARAEVGVPLPARVEDLDDEPLRRLLAVLTRMADGGTDGQLGD